MVFNDLKEFIQALQARGELRTISGAEAKLEIGGVSQIAAESAPCPALLFDTIDGRTGPRILTNILTSKARERLVFGIDEDLTDKDALRSLKDRLKQYRPVAPVKASQAPLLQNRFTGDQVDLTKLPWPRWHEGASARCHHDALVIMRDPGSGKVDIELADIGLLDRGTVSVQLKSASHSASLKNWVSGNPYPLAISLGHEPALLAAALLGSPDNESGYNLTGGLRGAPVQVIDGESTGLPIPASAEIVLEGEWSFTTGITPTAKIHCVSLRDDPIILGNAPFFGAVHGVLASRAASLWCELERVGVANISAVNQRPFGVTLLAIKQGSEGDVQRTAKALMECSAGRDLRYAVIVDDDIDPYNLEKVFWAIATRYEAQQAVQIVERLSDTASTGKSFGSVAIIDGCRPYRWIDKFPRTTDISDALMRQTVEKWGKVLERR